MYQHVNLLVTTHCNRACPDCCCGMPRHALGPPQHYDWPYFERAATFLRGLEVLTITGGEATTHPQFGRILREFDSLFEPIELELMTNGCDLLRYRAEWFRVARIMITDFDDPRSQAAIAAVRAWNPARLAVYPSEHVDVNRRGSGAPCGRRTIAAYAAGRLYPCCVSPGIPGAASMEPARDWREALEQVPLACADCCFSPSKLEEVAA